MHGRLIAVVGTNASGKSELGEYLAAELGGEVVSADSRQAYTGLDLGSGKVAVQERRVPYHLIDVADPGTRFSLADFQRLADAAIQDIATRGNVPVIVGGTGLYVSAVLEGYELTGVPPDAALRAELDALSLDGLQERLRRHGGGFTEGVDLANPRRLVRAIEIAESGVDFASMRKRAPRHQSLRLGLTWPAPVLERRIHDRLHLRMEQGMLEEVARLLGAGVPVAWLDSLGLEYRYLVRYLAGDYGEDLARMLEDLERAIRRFAKQQLRWFRRDPAIRWLDVDGDYRREALDVARGFLTTGAGAG